MAKMPAPPRPNPAFKNEPFKPSLLDRLRGSYPNTASGNPLSKSPQEELEKNFHRQASVIVTDAWLEPLEEGARLMIICNDYQRNNSDFITLLLIGENKIPVRFSFSSYFKTGKLFQASALGPACFSNPILPVRKLGFLSSQLEGLE